MHANRKSGSKNLQHCRCSQSYLLVAVSQNCQSILKMIVGDIKRPELESNVLSGTVESSGRHLISRQQCFDTSGLRSEKTRFGKWKRQKTLYLPPCSAQVFSFCFLFPPPCSKSYQPVRPITLIDFPDRDVFAQIYHGCVCP